MSQGQNVTVDVLIGSKCYCGRSELGRFVQASIFLCLCAVHMSIFRDMHGPDIADTIFNVGAHLLGAQKKLTCIKKVGRKQNIITFFLLEIGQKLKKV